jgi:hypothetical protein
MLKRFEELEPALVLLAADDETIKSLCPSNEDWIAIKVNEANYIQVYVLNFLSILIFFFKQDTISLLKPLEKATKYLSGTSYPTMGEIRLVYLGIQSHLKRFEEDNNNTQREVANLIFKKIDEYWEIMDKFSITSAILDPRNKLSVFTNQSSAHQHIQTIFEIYKERANSSNSSFTDPKPNTPRSARRYFLQLRQEPGQTTSANEVTPMIEPENSELDRYLAFLNEEEIDPLLWWQAHASEFPILCEMARDFLTIQATSVASEQVFSIAGHTITKTRNCLLPETARASLCMKSWISNNLINEM